jgi:hypothetical protein
MLDEISTFDIYHLWLGETGATNLQPNELMRPDWIDMHTMKAQFHNVPNLLRGT